MIQQSASTFPDHKYDFYDPVFIPALNAGGLVEGIWYRNKSWHYRIAGLPRFACPWWTEDQLELAYPNCCDADSK